MKIKTELKDNKVIFEVTPNQKDWKEVLNKTKQNMIKNIKIEGFRKGKVPLAIAEKYINNQELISNSIYKITNQIAPKLEESKEYKDIDKEILPYVSIDIKLVDLENITIIFEYSEVPTVEIKDYKSIRIEQPEFKVDKKEVEKEINYLLSKKAEESDKTSGKLEKSDIAIFDFTGFKDGKAFEGGSARNYELEIGSNSFIPGFEEQMIGMEIGSERELNLKFPEDYHSKELAGQDTTFKVKLNGIKTKKVPELNDKFVESLNLKNIKTVSELKKYTEDRLLNLQKSEFEQSKNIELLKKIREITTISHFSERQIEEEMKATKRLREQELKQQGINLQDFFKFTSTTEEEFDKKLREDVKDSIVISLAIEKIAKEQKLEVTEKDRMDYIEKLTTIYGGDPKEIREKIGNETERMDELIIKDKVIDYLIIKK